MIRPTWLSITLSGAGWLSGGRMSSIHLPAMQNKDERILGEVFISVGLEGGIDVASITEQYLIGKKGPKL